MGSTSEGPNPLRPYYTPPSIGLSSAPSNAGSSAAAAASGSQGGIGSAARDIFSDIDYSDYLGDSSPSISDSVKQLVDRALWRYSSVLMAQPLEIAKTILQVYVAQDTQEEAPKTDEKHRHGRDYRDTAYEDEYSLSSDDESSYFTSDAPLTPSPSMPSGSRRSRHRITDRRGYIPPSASNKHMIKIKDPSALLDVLSQLWSTSGPTSIWRGSNSSFICSLLLPTLNTFIQSLLSAILGFPEDGLSSLAETDILTSSAPGTTLLLSCVASALSAIILSPIDTTRTYIMLTPLGRGPRSLLGALRQLPTPSYLIPPHLLPITILSSTLPNLLTSSFPLFLKSYLSLDPIVNPSTWSVCSFLASGLELGLRFPLETVLRRAQIATFTSPALQQQRGVLPSPRTPSQQSFTDKTDIQSTQIETIVPTPQSYRGILGTIWGIVYEEGTDSSQDLNIEQVLGHPPRTSQSNRQLSKRRRGQGLHGLYRGWRLGMWGLIGVWGSGFLGAALGSGDEEIVSGATASRMSIGATSGRPSGGAGMGAF